MKIHIGENVVSGNQLYVPMEKLMETHTLVQGRTGQGKSYFLEILARAIIDNNYGFILLDGKGDLYENLEKYLADKNLSSNTVLINPKDRNQSVGINYLELFGNNTPDTLASTVLEGMMKLFKEDTEFKPWLEEWGPVSLMPLIKEGFTVLELDDFTDINKPDFRNAILSRLEEGYFRNKWDKLQKNFKIFEQANILRVLTTRSSKFWTSEPLKYIFGQKKTTIDWLRLMQKGGQLLANLGRGDTLTEKPSSFLGTAILHQLISNAPLRAQGKRRPLFLMVDEFERFVCNDFADALSMMRGFGVYLILSCQYIDQLKKDNHLVHGAVMSCCGNKFIFSISRNDAEEIAPEIYTGWMHQNEVKDEIRQTKLRPIEKTRRILSEGEGKTEQSAITRSNGTSFGTSENIQSAFSSSYGSGRTLTEQGEVSIESINTNTNFGSSQGTTRGTSEQTMEGTSHMKGEAITTQRSTSTVPWYEYEEYDELTSRQYYNIDQIKERCMAEVVNQDPRHMLMKLGAKKPIPVITAGIKPVRVLPSYLKKFKEKVYDKTTRPSAEIKKEIEERVKEYLGKNKEQEYLTDFREPLSLKELEQDLFKEEQRRVDYKKDKDVSRGFSLARNKEELDIMRAAKAIEIENAPYSKEVKKRALKNMGMAHEKALKKLKK